MYFIGNNYTISSKNRDYQLFMKFSKYKTLNMVLSSYLKSKTFFTFLQKYLEHF